MNEELSIIIRAVTDSAKKNIQGVKNELGNMGKEGGKSSAALGKGFKAVGVAAVAVVGTIVAVTSALTALANNTKQFRQEQAKLTTAFLAAGSTTEQAAESYKNLYRFLGDSGKATEAGAHLAKLTTNEKHLAEWTTALQGVYATFGDSLPIEGLTEAANETAKVGKVTGTMADALNWAGINEDAFNAQLAATNSESEREALIRGTLNSLYSDAARIYEQNNAALIASNEAQARLDATTAQLGTTTQPLVTALTNLSNALLVALAPAITIVTKALVWMVNALSTAVKWVSGFFGIVSGGKSALAGAGSIATSMGNAATGAGKLTGNLTGATKAAEKLKRVTAGFDELNVMSSQGSGGGAGGAIGGGGAGLGMGGGGFALDTGAVDASVEHTGAKFKELAYDIIKPALDSVKYLYEDIMDGIMKAWDKHGEPFKKNFKEFIENIKDTLTNFKEQFLLPLWEIYKSGIEQIWNESLKPLWDKLTMAIGNISNNLLIWWNSVLKPILDWVLNLLYPRLLNFFTWIKNIAVSIYTAIADVAGGIIGVVDGITDFITGVFTGDWKKAWEGVKKIFTGIWDSLVGVVKLPLNLIIDGINAMLAGLATAVNTVIKAVNKLSFTVPDWIPEYGGKTFGFNIKEVKAAQIPKLATGGIVDSATLAVIGERGKEAVLPLENNTAWMDKLVDKLAARTGAPSKIVLMLNEKELGWASINSINSITQQTGQLALRLM